MVDCILRKRCINIFMKCSDCLHNKDNDGNLDLFEPRLHYCNTELVETKQNFFVCPKCHPEHIPQSLKSNSSKTGEVNNG